MTLLGLAALIGSTKGAISKWERAVSPDIELDKFFALADALGEDPRTLALGETKDSPAIPPHRIGLIEKYGDLPQELRFNIRGLIETLAAAHSENYSKWSLSRGEEVKQRPQKKVAKEPSIDK